MIPAHAALPLAELVAKMRLTTPIVLGCAHGRAVGQPCPHCLGFAARLR